MGCQFLLQCVKVKSENEVAQLCPALSDPMDPMHHSLPGSSIHGIFRASVLEWGAIAFSAGPITSWQIDGETVADLILGGLPKSVQMVIAAMKLKDAYSLEGKL